MKNIYRISVKDASRNDDRVLLYPIFTSKKKAEFFAAEINNIEAEREAIVIKKSR